MGANNRAFSAPCFLAIYKKATAEKKNAEQLLPVVRLRASHEVSQILTHRELLTTSTYTPGAAKYQQCRSVQTNIMCQRGLATGHSVQPGKHSSRCPASLSAPQTLQAEVGLKKPLEHLTFAPNICSDVSEDFEVSCLFICFRSWDAVWSCLSPEMQNAALSSTVCVSGSDWCLLEKHPGGQEMCVAECLSGYWLAAFVPSWFLLFHMSGRTFALPGR